MSAINKNFVIKNGLEVDTNLILADSQTNKVGIGTTVPQYTLHVNGGIGATNAYVSGITTVINELRVGTGGTIFSVIAGPAGVGQSVGVGTAKPAFLLDVRSPVSTGQAALYVQGDVRVTGDLNIDDVSITNLNVSGISTFVGFATFRNNILVAGVGTVTTLNSTSGTITNLTGTSGTITTFNSTSGTITNLTNTNLNVTGIATIATLNATGIAVTNFTVYNNLSVGGISTFTNGPVLIGSGTSTGTASQPLQVTGGTYVSGNLGIGSTNPTSALFVVGDARVTGVITATTFSGNVNAGVGTITTLSSTNGTITNLTGTSGTITTLNSTSGTITNLTGTSGTITTLNSTSGTITNLTGTAGTITTFNSTSGTITNLTGTAGTITTLNSTSGTITNLNVTGISTLGTVRISSGIITATSGIVTYYGDGTYLTGTASSPNLQIVLNTGNTSTIGFNITGVSTLTTLNNTSGTITNLTGTSGTITTFNSTSGTITNLTGTNLNYSGIGTITNFKGVNINVTGIVTAGTVVVGGATTQLIVVGDARVTGILTVGSSSITLNGSTNIINVGNGVTINSSGINVTGVITATSFSGSGANLTGVSAGSTVFIDTTTNQEFFPLFTATTSGTITASGISTSKLTYNPSSGSLSATQFNSTSDINFKENIQTVKNALETLSVLRGVSFDWKETGRSSYGVIAQELEAVLPELVKQGEVKSVNYNGIIGVLIEAVKELKKEVEDLKAYKIKF